MFVLGITDGRGRKTIKVVTLLKKCDLTNSTNRTDSTFKKCYLTKVIELRTMCVRKFI